MTLRNIAVIATALSLAALVVLALVVSHLIRDPEVPSEPGNYVLLLNGSCELSVVRASPADSLVIRPIDCRPAVPALGMAAGFSANTRECGTLVFAKSTLGSPLICQGCTGGVNAGECPLSRFNADAVLRWVPIE